MFRVEPGCKGYGGEGAVNERDEGVWAADRAWGYGTTSVHGFPLV